MNPLIGEQISVCLLTYNHVDVIESTLQSVLDQTITGYEVIVSDDCSTDGTWDRILELAAKNLRIKPIQTPHNMGMPGNANFAVSQATGDYIAILHHDDIYRSDLLEKWAGVLERHPDISFVFNPYGKFGYDEIYESPMPGERIDGKWLLERHLFPHWGCVIRGTAMVRRDAWQQEGGMRERFGLLADIDLWMRLAMRGSVGYVDEPVIIVRQARPDYYPDIYKGDSWSWARLRYLYEIHAENTLAYCRRWRFRDRFRWLLFRARLSLETVKWLTYALVRNKHEMLRTSGDSETPYDLLPLRIYRRLISLVNAPGGGR